MPPNSPMDAVTRSYSDPVGSFRVDYRDAMRVLEIWRYPVKSLQGEMVDSTQVGAEGIEGDRQLAIFDLATGFGLTGRREAALLFAAARLVEGAVVVTLPDGSLAEDDEALSAWIGRPVALRSTSEAESRRFESPEDFEHEETSNWRAFTGALGSFRDGQDAAISIASTGSLGLWPQRRFRPNLVVSDSGEDELVGSSLDIGDARITVRDRLGRCVMVTRAQPGIDRDLDVLRTVHRERDHTFAVGATIDRAGRIAVGDELLAVKSSSRAS
ncbi:MAG: MOSC N-terminal beta barrel domain-containing protein [Rhodoglobus sp.]|nr:MOSC N-terminal beta barrel domain-containing protein [Rhodoglobus sp.]